MATVVWAQAASIDDVLERMAAIDADLPHDDGVAYFNRMYWQVTKLVDDAVDASTFEAGEFLARLDVHFANRFFEAYAADLDGTTVSAAWAPLFEGRARDHTLPIQFALAGMNAHINRDLPQGIVQVFEALGGDPTSDDVRRQDFDSVNELLERVEDEVKADFSVGVIGVVDIAAGRVDDIAAMWKVRVARKAAWTNAEVLWTLRRAPHIRSAFFDTLDRSTGLAGRGLLTPTAIDTLLT
jgi:Family of unknown function (DUF5995)